MPPAPLPEDESDRLAALLDLDILDSEAEPAFDALVALAASVAGTPTALMSLVDSDRQWFKARHGFDSTETPRASSFCGHTILGHDPLVIGDAAHDERVCDSALVAGGPKVRAYLGIPLRPGDGPAVGTICVMDYRPRRFTKKQVAELRRVGELASGLLSMRRAARGALRLAADLGASQRQIEILALQDALTGVATRRALDAEMRNKARQRDVGYAVLHLDIDRLGRINDSMGQAAGDAVLVHVADVLRANCRPGDMIARNGGDEFMVLCGGDITEDGLRALSDRLIAALNLPIDVDGRRCQYSASIGIARADGDLDPSQVLANADAALSRAKASGRARAMRYSETARDPSRTSSDLGDQILAGLDKGEFVPHYQVQVDARTLKVEGVEALVRWQRPGGKILTPDQFLPMAEELGVMGRIDRTVLAHALADLREWDEAGERLGQVSVNVSAQTLHDGGFLEQLPEVPGGRGRLVFELLESVLFDSGDPRLSWTIDALREHGIGIEVDDFGTGHASIKSLLALSPDRLKIDRQFVAPILNSPGDRQLLRQMIDIGLSLGVGITAEGVETLEHVEPLREMGCHRLQGYAFADPVPPSEIVALCRRSRWRDQPVSAKRSA